MKASAKDLRSNSKELLEVVERGEEITITYHGKAKLVPCNHPKKKNMRDSSLFGLWKDHEEVYDVKAYLDGLRGICIRS